MRRGAVGELFEADEPDVSGWDHRRRRFVLDGREPCQDGPSARAMLVKGAAGSGGPGPGDLDP